MQILQDVPLALHSTMRLGGKAAYAAEIYSRQNIVDAVRWSEQRKLPILMIGQGSNIVWNDEGFDGLLLINKIPGFQITKLDDHTYQTSIGAGEIWDSVVARCVDENLSGIECLSLIPGLAGATPVQNVGAYGQEIAQTLINIDVYDIKTKQFITISNKDCQFGYRTSRFKTIDHGKYLIINLKIRLSNNLLQPPFYSSLQSYLDEHNIKDYSPKALRDAVIGIRSQKLPDPTQVANNGSFFANPIINHEHFLKLQQMYPDIIHWIINENKIKISAAWLMDTAGFKDFHDSETGMATWPMQSLVFVNEHAKTTADLLKFKQKIISKIFDMFGIELEQEPELLP